jgi:hypothetical protein
MFEEMNAEIQAWRAANGRKPPTDDETFSLPVDFTPSDYDDHKVEDTKPPSEALSPEPSTPGPEPHDDFIQSQADLAGVDYDTYVDTLKQYGPLDQRDVVLGELGEDPDATDFAKDELANAQKKALDVLRSKDPTIPETFTKGIVSRPLEAFPETPKGGYVDHKVVEMPKTAPTPMSVEASAPSLPKYEEKLPGAIGDDVVKIVVSDGRLRAQKEGDPDHFVAFPNSLRDRPGSRYHVERLTWNGKNYRATGKITKIDESGYRKYVTVLKERFDLEDQYEKELDDDWTVQSRITPVIYDPVLIELDGIVTAGKVVGGDNDGSGPCYEVETLDGEHVRIKEDNLMVRRNK